MDTVMARVALRSMFMSNLRTLAVVILAAIGNSLLAWQTLAARDYDEAHQTTEVNRQTDSPKIQDDTTRPGPMLPQKRLSHTWLPSRYGTS